MDPHCGATLRRSRPRWRLFRRSIFDVDTKQLLDAAGRPPGAVDVVVGGPPCQPFSKAGQWAPSGVRGLEDPRATTLQAFLRVVQEALPRAFLLENVAGFRAVGRGGLDSFLLGVNEINKRTGARYATAHAVLDAADYGVPQHRSRLFVIGVRDNGRFVFPPARFGSVTNTTESLLPYRTAWDAIGDLPPDSNSELRVGGFFADLLPSIPEGHNYLWHTDRGGGAELFGWRRRYWSFLLKLAKCRPSWTISATPGPASGPFHWHDRRLSRLELCRLQTFPSNVCIQGGYLSALRQLGNAVPSLLAEVLAREIRVQVLGGRSTEQPPCLLPPDRSPPDEPEPYVHPDEIPAKYRSMIGKHAPHPGPRRGPGALAREALVALSGA